MRSIWWTVPTQTHAGWQECLPEKIDFYERFCELENCLLKYCKKGTAVFVILKSIVIIMNQMCHWLQLHWPEI